MTDFTAIGKPTPLMDGRAKVTGALRYAPDLSMPGTLHARFVTSAYAHANLRAIHIEQALAVPGVVAVLTARDLPDIPPKDRPHLMLARDRVLFVGQPVALVLATSEAAAHDGVDQVMVEYDPLPAATTLDEALAEGAPLVWPEGVGDQTEPSNLVRQATFTRGDLDAGFAEADAVIERTFTTPMAHQNSLETQGVLAQPDPVTGGVTLWSSTQTPFDVRTTVAEVLGVAESDVRVTGTPLGGGFGGKATPLYEPLAAAATRVVGRPVRLMLTRLEELLATTPAPALRFRLRLGAKRDGTLCALDAETYVDSGCFPCDMGYFAGWMLGSFYRIPNFRIRAHEVLTFKPSAGAYRAPCAPPVVFAIDTAVDALAQELHIDPLDMRVRNALLAGEALTNGDPLPPNGMREVLDAVRRHPVWQNRHQANAAGRGVGIALGGWLGGLEPAAAVCSLNRDGKLSVHVGAVDMSGALTGVMLMAAEAFGLAADDVRVIFSDTSTAPYGGTTGGSKLTLTVGEAVVNAVHEARRQVLEIASQEFEAAVQDLEIVDGKVQVRGVPSKAIPLSDIGGKGMQFGGKYPPIFAHGRSAQTTHSPAYNAQIAEIEVDRETGEVQVHRLVVVQDVGCAINPLAIQGQLTGGATQGVGWGLYEQMLYDENGQLLTGSWMDYAMPHSTQTAPVIETVIVEVPSETGPFGVRGVGEPPVVPTAAAIANAIANATGVRLADLPMTAPRVLAALNGA
jgi:CO/xanthine dehydrogenase Mo-binding subunit